MNRLTKFLIFLIFLFICSILISRIINPNEIEIRNSFLLNLLSGAFSLWIITVFFVSILINKIKKGIKSLATLTLMILCVISLIVSLTFTTWIPPDKKDAIVYQNIENPEEKLIFQFYLSGINESNPNWQIIKTANQYKIIRPIEILNDTLLLNSTIESEFPKHTPKKEIIIFRNEEYSLQEYMTMENWTTWKHHKIKITNR